MGLWILGALILVALVAVLATAGEKAGLPRDAVQLVEREQPMPTHSVVL